MRLGQLARKLSLRPSEIIEFLASRNITIEDGSNTKIDDDHVSLIIQQLAPSMQEVILAEANIQDETDAVSDSALSDSIVVQELEVPQEKPLDIEVMVEPIETDAERPEVIKAPKVELSGLKVLGKIELPDPKKKSNENAAEENPVGEPVKKEVTERKNINPRREPRVQRPSKNPIAFEREQEALEAKTKREAEAERQKEIRTKNYLKKVKTVQPTKAAKIIKEETEQMSAAELKEPPKTWWGKLVKWFTT